MSKMSFQILSFSILILLAAACSNQTQLIAPESPDLGLISDIKTICEDVPVKYAYFEERSAYWVETCTRAETEASSIEGRSDSLAVLERIVDDLYDPHASLNTHNQNSPRLVPSGSDLWIEATNDQYVVTAVRPKSGAAKAGVKVGDELLTFNGMAPDEIALTRIHAGKTDPSPDRVIWALNAAVAGTRAIPRNIEIGRDDMRLSFELGTPGVSLPNAPVTFEKYSGEIGYIRFNNSLGNSDTVSVFNAALESLRQTDGLILDLRETAGGGNTDVAEPILGRFIDKKMAYQRTVLRSGRATDRQVKPSGPWTYEKPVVVLVGRWTGSMGEGMAIGFDGMSRGTVMGSQMAGLAGGTGSIFLEQTGISVNLPTYDLHHLNGTPRHEWKPSELVTADNGAAEDLLLRSAILRIKPK